MDEALALKLEECKGKDGGLSYVGGARLCGTTDQPNIMLTQMGNSSGGGGA